MTAFQLIAVDLETTGLDSFEHGICQIGAYTEIGGRPKTFSMDCDPLPCAIDQGALDINGFTRERIAGGTPIALALVHFADWLAGCRNKQLVFQNSSFDIGFLRSAFRRLGPVGFENCKTAFYAGGSDRSGNFTLDNAFGLRRVLDTVSLGYGLIPTAEKPFSLAQLATKLNLTHIGWAAHDALSDARMTYFSALKLLAQRERTRHMVEQMTAILEQEDDDRISLGRDYNPNNYASGYAAGVREVQRLYAHDAD